jgi:signal transduction histidine kinase
MESKMRCDLPRHADDTRVIPRPRWFVRLGEWWYHLAMSWRGMSLWEMLQYMGLAVTAVTMTVSSWGSGWPLYAEWALLVCLGVLYYHWPEKRYHLYLAVQLVLVVPLVWLDLIAAILGFTFSAHAMLLLPGRTGMCWTAALALLIGAVMAYEDGLVFGLLISLGFGLGYFSFGYANLLRVRAETARKESERLLEELQQAHRQLQAHAQEAEDLAVARERNRMAREMHDTLGHRLTVAAVQLEGAQRLIPGEPQRAAHMVGTVRDEVREALSELRRAVATLRTPPEADLSLPHALERLTAQFEQSTGLTMHLELPQDIPSLPATHRLALYRAAQEALTNVQRHAQAEEVWLRLTSGAHTLALEVADNGVGIAETAEDSGFGLRGLQERAAQLGGTLALSARPGGTTLTLRLPSPMDPSDG